MLRNWLDNRDYVRLAAWGGKAGVAILDQALFSGGNFIFNILLARWLPAEKYGAFSLVFTIYLLVSSLHNAVILEPMIVFGTSKHSNNLANYIWSQLSIHLILTPMVGILIALSGFLLLLFPLHDGVFLSVSIINLGLCLPFMLLFWLARQSCYVIGEPGLSLKSSFIYLVILLGTSFVVHAQFQPGYDGIWFLLMGCASLAGALVVFGKLKNNLSANNRLDWKHLMGEQIAFGKWIMVAAFLNFAATQTQIFFAVGYLGLAQAGAFRALQNFMLPMFQVLTAFSNISLPSVVYEFGRQNFREMKRKSMITAMALFPLSIIYLVILYFFPNPIEQFLYGGKFSQYLFLIPVTGLIPVITAIEVGFSLIVRSLQRPVYHAVLTGAMAVTGLFLGSFMIKAWGIVGAVYSLVLVALCSLLVNIFLYRRWFVPELVEEKLRTEISGD
jgi:O-antigen/teichoic acid export membrane protein